ncbi:hypothetical protein LCGC14_2087490, partial [marine sediment metagenome]
MLREWKALGVNTGETDTVASGSTANLYDDRSKLRVEWAGNTPKILNIYKNAATTAEGVVLRGGRLNRVIIPKGHNFFNDRAIFLQLGQTLVIGGLVTPKFSDLVAYARIASSSNLIDLQLDPASTYNVASMLKIFMDEPLVTANSHGLGELWWTDTVQPVTGIASVWEDASDGIFDRLETRSGERYVQKRGDSKRLFTHMHQNLSGADLLLYDLMYLDVGHGLHPFWYEGPDTGDAEVVLINEWDPIPTITTTFSSTAVAVAASSPDNLGRGIMIHAAGSQNLIEWKMAVTELATIVSDWHNHIIRMQIRADWSTVAVGDIKFFVESGVGGNTA